MDSVHTAEFVCVVHNRAGDHPSEKGCPDAYFRKRSYVPGELVEATPGADVSAAKSTAETLWQAYRRKPEPATVEAKKEGAFVLIANGNGPAYPVPIDEFMATYELLTPESAPEDQGPFPAGTQNPPTPEPSAEPGQIATPGAVSDAAAGGTVPRTS